MLKYVVNFRLKGEELSLSNCIQRLRIKEESKWNVNDEVNFIASYFWKLTSSQWEELKKFDVEILERILSSKSLYLKDEDSLVEFISSLGEEYKRLYDYVELQFLTSTGIKHFLRSFSLENIDCRIWESLSRRLQCELSKCKLNGPRFNCISDFPFTKVSEWNGLVNHLTKKCNGNAREKGIINITSSGDCVGKCWDVVNPGYDGYWESERSGTS
jgi:hypothetical protein